MGTMLSQHARPMQSWNATPVVSLIGASALHRHVRRLRMQALENAIHREASMTYALRFSFCMLVALLCFGGGVEAQQSNMTFFITSAGPGKGAELGGLAGAD